MCNVSVDGQGKDSTCQFFLRKVPSPEQLYERIVYLGRYAGQQRSEVLNTPIDELELMVNETSKLVKAENDAMKRK